jgi:phosphoadenosine phosphosulfate reductase
MRLLETGALEQGRGANARADIAGGADLDALTPQLAELQQIVVDFPVFRDGRGFSLAAVLRGRGYRGELVARGHLLPDQARHLARTGFDAVELSEGADRGEWERSLSAYSAAYQPAEDDDAPIWRRRRGGVSELERDAGGKPLHTFPHPAPAPIRVVESLEDKARRLNAELRDAAAEEILAVAIGREFQGRVALLTSFGAESAVGLHMVSQVAPETPVLFLDTERHFDPTLQYRDRLAKQLGLTDVRSLKPDHAEREDPKGDLWRTNADLCCAVRKVRPLQAALSGFDALITGRKRFHGGARLRLPVFEVLDGTLRVNPFAGWGAEEVDAYYLRHDLARHPLVEGGYRSIGCWPCTRPARDEDARSGRWAGLEKTECGIHLPAQWAANVERRRAS